MFCCCGGGAQEEALERGSKINYLLSKKSPFCPNCSTRLFSQAKSFRVCADDAESFKTLQVTNCCGASVLEDKVQEDIFCKSYKIEPNVKYRAVMNGKVTELGDL